MAPRKKVTGQRAAVVRQETTDDRRRARESEDVAARIAANRKHLAVTGRVMPQGGRHRPENTEGTV